MEGHDMEKSEIREIRNLAAVKNIKVWDSLTDFGINEALFGPFQKSDHNETPSSG